MATTDDPFLRGELVTLREYPTPDAPIGRVVSVSPDGASAEVAWTKYTGHDHELTVERTVRLRKIHESEMEPEE